MISYKASYTKADLYQLLSKYEKRLEKKVEDIANKVINMSNIDVWNREESKKACSINPEKERNTRSISMIESLQKPGTFVPKHKIISNIEEKIVDYHLPKIKGDKEKEKGGEKVWEREKGGDGKKGAKAGRSIGKYKYTRPKFQGKKPYILPKEVRNNPFTEPRPVPVSELKHGLLNLMNKGIINKDVDISVAFEWGQAPFQSKGAVIHSYDQVLIQEQLQEPKMIKQKRDEMMPSFPSSIKNVSPLMIEREGWAITAMNNSALDVQPSQQVVKPPQPLFSQIIHIEFKNYLMKTDTREFLQYKKRNIQIWGSLLQVFKFIESHLRKFSINLAFIDGRKAVLYSYNLRKMSVKEIQDCMIGSVSEKKKFKNIKRMPNGPAKQRLAVEIIIKLLKSNIIWNEYKKTILIKECKQRISNWVNGILERRKTRVKIQENLKLRNERIKQIQSRYESEYDTIESGKHCQIHIPSQPVQTPAGFLEKLNTQITRIFHLKANVNIIYVSPIEMTEETINYYYKIMELGEVQHYKDRIQFIQCEHFFTYHHLTLSEKIYYDSKAVREIKKLIKGTQAVIVPGEIQEASWYLADALNTPLVTNFRAYQFTKRSAPLHLFRTLNVPYIPFWKVDITPTGEFYVNQLARKITNFASDSKLKTLTISIDGDPESTATVKCPVRNFEDLIDKTTILNEHRYPNPNAYYKKLLQTGGVAEKYDTFRYLRTLVYISPNRKVSISGTFEKILTSTNAVISVCFPQEIVDNERIEEIIGELTDAIIKDINYYGYLEVDFVVDKSNLMLEGMHWGLSEIGSSLFYFEYLANAKQTTKGYYQSQIIEPELAISVSQYRSYVYCPYILHFGLNQFQLKNFFQLCRSQGISFDLQKKYGSAFTLLQGVKNAVGILATAKTTKISLGLIIQAIGFIYRQTVKNIHEERETRMKDKNNILTIKSRLQQCYNRGVFD